MNTPLKPGQRRHAVAARRTLTVRTVRPSRTPGHWICLVEPDDDPMLIAEGEFSDLIDDSATAGQPAMQARLKVRLPSQVWAEKGT